MNTTASADDIQRILSNDHHDPFAVLGAHLVSHDGIPAVAIRAYLPDASSAFVIPDQPVDGQAGFPMQRVRKEGFFEALIPGRSTLFRYQLRKTTPDGRTELFHDSYSFMPTLTDFDIYLFNAGDHHKIY